MALEFLDEIVILVMDHLGLREAASIATFSDTVFTGEPVAKPQIHAEMHPPFSPKLSVPNPIIFLGQICIEFGDIFSKDVFCPIQKSWKRQNMS